MNTDSKRPLASWTKHHWETTHRKAWWGPSTWQPQYVGAHLQGGLLKPITW